ncbi:MAG: hypothetical protein NVSMB64_18570 [Candidatus Velthaea sp.]
MANPVIPGVTYPSAHDNPTLTAFIANNLDISMTFPGSSPVYAIGGAATAVVNNILSRNRLTRPVRSSSIRRRSCSSS